MLLKYLRWLMESQRISSLKVLLLRRSALTHGRKKITLDFSYRGRVLCIAKLSDIQVIWGSVVKNWVWGTMRPQ